MCDTVQHDEEEVVETCETCDEPLDECTCSYCDCGRRAHNTAEPLCSRCEHCPEHCDCPYCDSCSEPCEYTCDNCERCEECCGCYSCQVCDNRFHSDDYCGECDRCNECCNCRSEDRAVELIEPTKEPTFHESTKLQRKRNPSARMVSCELEFVGASDGDQVHDAVSYWDGAIVEDGSLPDSGFEICTAPANGDLFVEQVEEITAALAEQDAEVSAKCGFHVHVDARDFTYWDVRKLIVLYARIEDALFQTVPMSRRNNHYCERCSDRYLQGTFGKEAKNRIIDTVYGTSGKASKSRADTLKGLMTHKYNAKRYAALNLHSWFYRGTIECRLAAGTANCEKIVNWARLWASILDYALAHSEAEIRALPVGWETLEAVCPADIRGWLKARREKF